VTETPIDTLLPALVRAKELFKRNHEWDLLRALAEATTTAACGMPGYKVFRDARAQVQIRIKQPLPQFCRSTPRSGQVAAIDGTIHALRGRA
jgi:hypothetical protein